MPLPRVPHQPLDHVDLLIHRAGHLRIFDGDGRLYLDTFVRKPGPLTVTLAGSLGTHSVHWAPSPPPQRVWIKVWLGVRQSRRPLRAWPQYSCRR